MRSKISQMTDALRDEMRGLTADDTPDFKRMPQAGGALYVPPAPGFTRRSCDNCCLWITPGDECDIHAPDVKVVADATCGYWVGGTPLKKRSDRKILHVLPEFSGLETVKGGTHCGNCKWFKKGDGAEGLCQVVANAKRDGHQEVHEDGCCALWEG